MLICIFMASRLLQGAFAHFSKANQYSLASIENELSNDSLLDTEFDKHVLDSNQLDNDRGSHMFTDSGATATHSSQGNSNPLEAAVNAVKKYRCVIDSWLR